jgi:hypothetical protein
MITQVDQPIFECSECGFQDYMGNMMACPICQPEKEEETQVCFFVNMTSKICRQDGKICSQIEDESWEECPKLEKYNPGIGKS